MTVTRSLTEEEQAREASQSAGTSRILIKLQLIEKLRREAEGVQRLI
jgi:hypothetical protein